jgi:hypothetical protein
VNTFNYRVMTCVVAIAGVVGCGGSDKASTPTITAVAPTTMCADGGTLTVTGTDFQDGAVVKLGASGSDLATTFVSDSSLTAVVPPGQTAGVYDVVVENPDGGTATLTGALTIVDDPLIFFVDPPTIYNALSIEITIYAGGINGSLQTVEIAPHGSTTRQSLSGFTQDPDHAGRIEVTLPAGLAAGAYDLYITDDDGCEGALENAFTVTADAALTLTSIDPAFGWTGADTAVTITATGGLAETPRVYFSPQAGGVAAAGRAVVWVDASTLTVIVPQGLTPGMYDVIVIDPDGTVGVLNDTAGFNVTSDPPPQIDGATPGSVDSGTATAVTLDGSGFDSAATVTMSCVDSTGVQLPDQQITPESVAVDGTSLTFTTPVLTAGTVCVLTVTNPDGTFGTFSALTVTNPASNLEPFQTSDTAPDAIEALTTPRRALVVVAGHVSNTQRYLYAIGGDDGTVAGALDTVESTSVDLFGRMVGWTIQAQGTQPRTLDTPRTLAKGARVGQYFYLAGGTDGTNVLGSIVRARILDPLNVPEFGDIDFRTDTADGLAPGNWVYRISAVVPGDGETLPSDPINIAIPDLSETSRHVEVTITWTAVAGATGYKIYRTRAADDPSATVAFLADATTTSFADDGSAAPAADALPPLTIGSLGTWTSVATLTTARMGAAVTAAQGATANDWFLYVGGGNDGTQALASYEYLPITIDPTTGGQTVGTVTVGASTIGTARWNASAWTADASVTSVAGTNSWVYFGTGENTAGTNTVAVTAVGQVDPATGELTATLTPSPTTLDILGGHSVRSGTGAVAASGFLYDFGGGPTPSAGGSSAEICAPGVAGCTNTAAPDLSNWNSLGAGGVLVPRYLTSAAIESAFIFVAGGYGGLTGTEVLTSVERTIR